PLLPCGPVYEWLGGVCWSRPAPGPHRTRRRIDDNGTRPGHRRPTRNTCLSWDASVGSVQRHGPKQSPGLRESERKGLRLQFVPHFHSFGKVKGFSERGPEARDRSWHEVRTQHSIAACDIAQEIEVLLASG